MTLEKEPSGRRSVAVQIEVPGTPEEVWQAIATGPGVSAWFVPTEVRDDGTVVANFGPGMESKAQVIAWDPPHRFAAESADLGPENPTLATEWIVEAQAGGTCIVRVVHSLFASNDDWDDQLRGFEAGWPWFLEILRLYLTHFRGQPSAAFRLIGAAAPPAAEAWDKLAALLGVQGSRVGEWRMASALSPPLAGVVERVGGGGHPNAVLVRLDEPHVGVLSSFAHPMGGQVVLAIDVYLYGPGAAEAAARAEPAWSAWIAEHFPLPSLPPNVC
ncbi:MAG: SRPBCC domain-containing protein [Pirellulales bacterium]